MRRVNNSNWLNRSR